MSKIYVASSWSNDGALLDWVHMALRHHGFETLDFRAQGKWWENAGERSKHFGRARAASGVEAFEFDYQLMLDADGAFVVHPCGIATALEAAWFVGRNKPVVVWGEPRDGQLDITWLLAEAEGRGALMLGEHLETAVLKLLGLVHPKDDDGREDPREVGY